MCDLADTIEKEGKLVLLIKLLKAKMGSLTNETVMCIRNASMENLDELIDNFMGVENEGEIFNLLTN